MSAGAHPTLAEHRARMREGLRAVTEAAHRLTAPLTPAQLAWQPGPERWSVLHCFDHLAVTNRAYRAKVEPILARTLARDPANDARPYRARWHARWMIRMTGPEGTRKFPAPKVFRPALAPSPDALHRFFAEQAWLDQTLATLAGLNDDALRVVSPATPLMRFTLAESFEMILGHDRRHLAQAERVAAML